MLVAMNNSSYYSNEELLVMKNLVSNCKKSYMIYEAREDGTFSYDIDNIKGFVNSCFINKNNIMMLDVVLFELESKYSKLFNCNAIGIYAETTYNKKKYELVAFTLKRIRGI